MPILKGEANFETNKTTKKKRTKINKITGKRYLCLGFEGRYTRISFKYLAYKN